MSARFEIVHGDPDEEEIAVVVSLLSAAATAAPPPTPVRISNWGRPVLRQTPAPGSGAWVRTGLPHP